MNQRHNLWVNVSGLVVLSARDSLMKLSYIKTTWWINNSIVLPSFFSDFRVLSRKALREEFGSLELPGEVNFKIENYAFVHKILLAQLICRGLSPQQSGNYCSPSHSAIFTSISF